MQRIQASKTNHSRQPILPEFRLINNYLFCDHRQLNLQRRPLTRKLIQAFLARPNQFISRDDLVDIVYNNFDPETKSRRFNEALRQNITKMVSRARSLTESVFNQGTCPWIELFVYIPDQEGWCLFRLKNEYLAERQTELMRFAVADHELCADKSASETPGALPVPQTSPLKAA